MTHNLLQIVQSPAWAATHGTNPETLLDPKRNPLQNPEGPGYTAIEFRRPTAADEALLDRLSLKKTFLHEALIQTFDRQKSLIAEAGLPAFQNRLQSHFNPFESTLLECGCAVSLCPVCGRACIGRDSYIVRDTCHFTTFYRFQCHVEFYIMKGAPSTAGLYIPEHELIVRYIDEDLSLGQMFFRPEQLMADIDRLKACLWLCLPEAMDYAAASVSRTPYYFTTNFAPIGHHLVNELPGLQRLIDAGLSDRLRHVVESLWHYFDLPELFPEIGRLHDWRNGHEDFKSHTVAIFRRALQQNAFSLHCYHNGPIQETLWQRLAAYARKRTGPAVSRSIEAIRTSCPRIWITLRTGNRSWVTQNPGLVRLIRTLHADYPDMTVIFDGLPKENEDLQKITAQMPPAVRWVDALHCTREETLHWMHFIDMHISPVGNGGTFISLANKPGVYHGNSRILKHYCTGPDNAEAFSLHPRERAVHNLAAAASKDYTPEKDMHFCDYEVDVDDLIVKVRRILAILPTND